MTKELAVTKSVFVVYADLVLRASYTIGNIDKDYMIRKGQ